MLKKSLLVVIATLFTAGTTQAAGLGPCQQVRQACLSAGFIQNTAKSGTGLWVNCIDPIMQGTTSKKAKIALPTVDPNVISACKAKRPKFGSGKVAN